MAQIKALIDEHGVILQAVKQLPNDDLKLDFLTALAELEDHEAHRKRDFPKTRLHRVTGVQQAIYRAYINKTSGWRIHVQYENGRVALKDVISGQLHDDVVRVIKSKKKRYR
jgi:hypothetical protein